jgi:cytoskeleton protein RodZ
MDTVVDEKPQFGAVLKQARESQKLSIEDVAKQLNLPVARIKEIEQGELLSEFSVAFYRGYVRAYATFLKIEPATVLELFNETVKADIEISSNQRLRSFSSARKESNTGSKLFKWFSFIIIVAVLLIVGWGLKQRFVSNDGGELLGEDGLVPMTSFIDAADDTETNSRTTTNSNTTAGTGQTTEFSKTETVNDSLQPVTSPQGAQLDDDGNTSDSLLSNDVTQPKKQTVEQLKQQLESEAVEESPSVEKITEESVSSSTPVNENDTALSQSADTNDITDSSSTDPQAESMQSESIEQLVFAFVGECWVDIQDATGERLAYGIKNNGKVMTLRGVPPFEITLGDPSVVRLQHEQQTIDLSHYRAGQTAKITIE